VAIRCANRSLGIRAICRGVLWRRGERVKDTRLPVERIDELDERSA
jgi:hypothetical protein